MKVKFVPQNIEVEVTSSKTLLQIATENNIEIKSICKGVPSCAECRVRITEGERNILPPTKVEIGLIGSSYYIDGRRLSCQVRCFGNVTVDLTEQLERAEVQNKKVRGFKSQRAIESKAIQDTFILNDPSPNEKNEPDGPSANKSDASKSQASESATPSAQREGQQKRHQDSQQRNLVGQPNSKNQNNSNSGQNKGNGPNQRNSRNNRSRPNKGKA